MKPYTGKVPFHPNFPNSHSTRAYTYFAANTIWKDNTVFEDTLKFVGLMAGAGCSLFEFESTTRADTKFVMFPTDFAHLLKTHTLVNGVVSAKWTYCKRGTNYGTRLAT